MVQAKARAVGFNHVALEVGDIQEALAFYGRLFEFELRGKSGTSARPIPRTAKGPDSTGWTPPKTLVESATG